MSFIRASFVWHLGLCVVAIACVGQHEMISVFVRAETSISDTFSIPSQILSAKVPSAKENSQQSQYQQQQQQLWLYEGALYDPLDGRKVAKVRGLELVQPLENTSHLAIDALLNHPNATYQDSMTVWSQKIFCYTTEKDRKTTAADTVEDGHQEQPQSMQESILDSVRVRPRSPRKEVPLDQAVAVYETATTFVSRRTKNRKRDANVNVNDGDDDETEVLVHSEWPNGQTMWGIARDCSQQTEESIPGSKSSTNIDFTIFAKLRNKNSPLYSPDLIRDDESEDNSSGTRTTKNGDIIVSPKRASLIQFGSSDGTMETKHKFGARETYSYRNIRNDATAKSKKGQQWFPFSRLRSRAKMTSTSPTVYYTRYGEGPPFYAPGRMCMLELRGRPVNNLGEVGPLLKGLILGDSSRSEQRGNRRPPISNFHWNEGDETKEATTNDVSKHRRRGKGSKGVMVSSNEEYTPVSIQTAWNLREIKGELSIGKNNSNAITKQLERRRRQTRQPLALKLTVVDDTSMTTGRQGIRKWNALAKRGKNCATAFLDRIRASTTMESRS